MPGSVSGFEIVLKPSKLQKEGDPEKGHFRFLRQLWYGPYG